MKERELIEKLNYIIDNLGVKQCFIEREIGIRHNTLFFYKNMERHLSEYNLELLEKLLKRYNI